jgi:hypothetical protein
MQPALTPAPAARREQPAQDFAQPFRAPVRHIAAYGHINPSRLTTDYTDNTDKN